MKLLLDSHTLLWALYEPERLPAGLHSLLADKENELFVSHATLWEIGNKAAAHRLPMAGSSVSAIVGRTEEFGVTLLPLHLEELMASSVLPRHHDDPFDRVLVAQAQAHRLIIATRDRRIPLYGIETVWA